MIRIEKIDNEELTNKLKNNNNYCPEDPSIKCLCKEFREAEHSCICHCGLYKKTITKD